MLGKLLSTTVLVLGATIALAQTPPAGGAPANGPSGNRMDPAARFKELDKNSDGKLSLEELSSAQFGRAGANASTPAAGAGDSGAAAVAIADRFKTADANKDGSLSMEEFTAMIQSMRSGGGGMGAGGMGGG